MEKTNILYLIPTIDIGGAEKVVLHLSRNIDRQKYNVIVGYWAGENKLLDEFEKSGIEVIRFNFKKLKSWNAIISLVKFFKERNIKILHTHLTDADYLGAISAKIAKVPVLISTIHASTFLVLKRKNRFNYRLKSFFFDTFVCVSFNLRNYLIKNCSIDCNKIRVIYNSVEDEFLLSGKNSKKNSLVIGTVGRLHSDKGQKYLLEGFSEVLKYYPDCSLIFIGDGQLKHELKNLADVLKISERVNFINETKNIREQLDTFDIFVLPSLTEGLPLSLLEAQARGIPVIATNVGGIPEIIKDGLNGLLIQPRDSEAIKQAILALLRDKNKMVKMGLSGKEIVENYFSPAEMIEKYARLYDDFVEKKIKKAKPVIVHIIEQLNRGGLERTFYLTVKNLDKKKYRVIVYCLAGSGEFAQHLMKDGIEVRILNLRWGYYNPLNIIKLAIQFKKDKADIVHSHSYSSNVFAHLANFLVNVPIKIVKIASFYSGFKKRHFFIERKLSKFTSRIIAVSEAVKTKHIEELRIDSGKMTVIYNAGIGEKKTYNIAALKQKWGIKENEKVVGTLSRLHPVKGVEYLIKAASEITKEYSSVKFLIAGDGELKEYLQKLSFELGVNEKIVFCGWIDDVGEILKVLDIFVLTSTEREGFSSALAEAAGFSLPLVASDIGGNKEIVIEGINGLLVEQKDVKQLKNAILTLLKNDEKRKEMSRESKKIFCGKFNLETMIKNIENLYDTCIKEKNKCAE